MEQCDFSGTALPGAAQPVTAELRILGSTPESKTLLERKIQAYIRPRPKWWPKWLWKRAVDFMIVMRLEKP